MVQNTELYQRLRKQIDTLPVVDSHEHVYMPEEDYLEMEIDFTRFFLHYTSSDLISAGMDLDDMDRIRTAMGRPQTPSAVRQRAAMGHGPLSVPESLSTEQKWERIRPYWLKSHNTAYCQAVRRCLRRLYDVEDLLDDTWQIVTERMRAAQRPGIYRSLLKDICNIELSINDADDMATTDQISRMDRELFLPVGRVTHFLDAWDRVNVAQLEQRLDVSILSWADLLRALDSWFERMVAEHRGGVKIGHAYMRTLQFADPDEGAARRIFERAFTFNRGASAMEAKPFQDTILHETLKRCSEFKLPVIFHTGLQEGNCNLISHANVTHLIPLFIHYPRVTFDIFHGSYPYLGELAAVAKNFPNVRVDLAWLHIIAPHAARRSLHEWLEAVPANKIHGFGGDYLMPEAVYGHLDMARENIAVVLAEKVREAYFSEQEALQVAGWLLRDNPRQTFGLDKLA